jgi:hypothetical protein
MANLLINLLLTMASVFGLYTLSRLYALKQTYWFYILWLLIQSCMFFCYFLVKNENHLFNPIFYEIISPIFYLAPGFLYLFFMVISDSQKSTMQYILTLLPIITIAIFKVVLLWLYYDKISERVLLFKIHINTNSATIAKIPFQIEQILFLCRNILAIIYIIIIDKSLKKNPNTHLRRTWDVIFKPYRINVYFIIALMIAQFITRKIFLCEIGAYIFINSIICFAATMYFWHLSLLLKDLENSNSIFRLPSAKSIANPNIPQESLLILQYIYLERVYKDNNLSIEKVAKKMEIPNFNLGQIFGTSIPFSFSSYINHLRLLEYENGFNSKLDKTSNAINAGFNSLSAYYYWESRKEVISKQINPILDWIDNHDTSKNKAYK